jgi:hypothetical protein
LHDYTPSSSSGEHIRGHSYSFSSAILVSKPALFNQSFGLFIKLLWHLCGNRSHKLASPIIIFHKSNHNILTCFHFIEEIKSFNDFMKRLPATLSPVCLASSWQAGRLAKRAGGDAALFGEMLKFLSPQQAAGNGLAIAVQI